MTNLASFVDQVVIDPEIYALRKDLKVLVIALDDLVNGPSDDISRSWLERACATTGNAIHEPHVDAWRAAYRQAGIKPQKFRPSFDALLRRAPSGLPEVNRIVDAYNAVSVKYGLPIGGENVDAYRGPLRLTRATGSESFDTNVLGEPVIETVQTGEVIWRDDYGSTCRRWNWRQCTRTRIDTNTRRAFFLFEALDPFSTNDLHTAANELTDMISPASSSAVRRLITST